MFLRIVRGIIWVIMPFYIQNISTCGHHSLIKCISCMDNNSLLSKNCKYLTVNQYSGYVHFHQEKVLSIYFYGCKILNFSIFARESLTIFGCEISWWVRVLTLLSATSKWSAKSQMSHSNGCDIWKVAPFISEVASIWMRHPPRTRTYLSATL